MDANRDLLSVEFWTAMQQEHRAGRVPDIYPYPQSKRFVNRPLAVGAG
jgi:isocitrate dehydrogenase kinase/phosphatase